MMLPQKKTPALRNSPAKLVIYSAPKAGKTTLLSQLDNCLIIDLENGTDFVEALKIKANNLNEFYNVGKEIMKANKPYKYVAIDTISKLEEWCEADALEMYKKTPMGANYKGESVLTLANGAGYLWLRKSMDKWLSAIYELADTVILVGHLKDKLLTAEGKEVASKDLDLTGKIRNIVCSQMDAICHLYRKDDKLIANFKSSEEVTCGSRCNHLKGQEIVISEIIDGKPVTHWNKIFVD